MKAEIKGENLIITIPLQEKTLSKTEKTYIIASTGGFKEVPGLKFEGKPVKVSVNAFINK